MCCSVLCREKGNKQGGLYGTRDLKVSKAQNLKTRLFPVAAWNHCCCTFTMLQFTRIWLRPANFPYALSEACFAICIILPQCVQYIFQTKLIQLKMISETCSIKVTRRRDRSLTSQWNDFCFTFSDSNGSFCYLTLSGRPGTASSRKHWGEATFFLSAREKKRAGFGVPARLVECVASMV